MEPRTTNPRLLLFQSSYLNRRYLKISIFLLVVVLILIGIYHGLRSKVAHQMTESSYFTVILDCGSTGTRIHVYEWLRNRAHNQDQPILLHSFPNSSTKSPLSHTSCEYHCMQTEPGLDKFLHNTSGISFALDPLLLWAEHQIPSERHGNTPIFLLGTAGLRRLPSEDAGWVLENAESVLKKHRFMYRRSWIRVLTGKEEAYYGWIALNYNLGRLGNYLNSSGILDLGGSSMQVVMETEKSRDDQHFLESKIGSVEVRLLAYSVPAFGLNEAFERSIVLLRKDVGNSSYGRLELKHPCLNSGFAQNYTCHGCYAHLNVTNEKNVNDMPLDSYHSTPIYLVGDPDWEQCKELARATVVNSESSDWLQLSSDMDCKAHSLSNRTGSLKRAASHSVAHFHALSGFFAVYKMLNLNPGDNMTELLERGKRLCSKPWEELKRISGDRNFVEQLCFRPPYLAALIEDGLCMGDAEIIFGPGDVSWTLGASLVEADFLWSIDQREDSDAVICRFCVKNLEVMSTPFLLVLILCLIFIICYGQIKLFLNSISSKKGSLPICIPKKTVKLITK